MGQILRPGCVLAGMTVLQMLWLGVIWTTGTASNAWKIPPLLLYTGLAWGMVQIVPNRLTSWLDRQVDAIARQRVLAILGLALIVAIAGTIYAAYQEVLTDEGYLLRASKLLADDGLRSFFTDYVDIRWLGGQHPPLIPLIYGFAIHAVGPGLLAMRAIATAVTLGTVLLTYLLAEAWLGPRTGFVAALFLVSMPYCLRMGTAALTDMPVTFFFLLSLFLIDRLARSPSLLLSIAAGVAIALGLLSKYTMLLIYPVLFCYIAAVGGFRRVSGHVAVSALASAIVVGAWLAFAHAQGILAAQAETVSGYARAVTGGGWRYMIEMISTELTSAVGLYNLPLILWGILHCLNSRSTSDLLVLLWILPVFAIVTLTLPDPRYFMPAFPALAIAMARGTQDFRQSEGRIVLLALLLCGGALYLFADWYRATFLFLP